MIKEYLKLARSYNAVLTGIAPVMGAIAMRQYDHLHLFLLFLVGFFGHTYGFVLNDIMDYKVDKYSKKINDRPLISGTISIKKAWILAIASMITSFIVALYISSTTNNFFPIVILTISAILITIYDLISKNFPFMDIFVALAIFFLILYGANTTVDNIYQITKLIWIVCILGLIQVLYMQIVAGGIKDIQNDYLRGAKTAAIKMGVKIDGGKLKVSLGFKVLTYIIQLANIVLVFLPFFIIWKINNPSIFQYFQWSLLAIITISMFVPTYKLFSMKHFDRSKAVKLAGIYYICNFALVPIMLMGLNPWVGLLVFFPGLGFILSNIILHGTILQPKTM
jgi:4-hydroxybenzoate polyprenyltransferase